MGNKGSSGKGARLTFPHLTESQIEGHKKLFGTEKSIGKEELKDIIQNRNFASNLQQFGKVNAADLPGLLIACVPDRWIPNLFGYDIDKYDRLFTAMDISKDGRVELDEFLYFVNLFYGAQRYGDTKALFEIFYRLANLSHTNKLSAEEAKLLAAAVLGIPVKEGESVEKFVARSSEPAFADVIKKQARLLVKPDDFVIQRHWGTYEFIPSVSNPKTTDELDKLWEKSTGAGGFHYLWYYQGKQLKGDLPANLPKGKLDDPIYYNTGDQK